MGLFDLFGKKKGALKRKGNAAMAARSLGTVDVSAEPIFRPAIGFIDNNSGCCRP